MLFQKYQNKSEPVLSFGNHIWLAKEVALLPSYAESIQGAQVDVDSLDFTAPSALDDINYWVNNITK